MGMYSNILDNLSSFVGNGTYFILFLCSILLLLFSMKTSEKRIMLVCYPLFCLLVFFCPIWLVYFMKQKDGEILYRILWLVPIGTIVCFAFVEFIGKVKGRARHFIFVVAALILVLGGDYIYNNVMFTKSENEYHVPQTVVDICDEIIIPGREIAACFPDEFVNYVRQYTAMVYLPYGRSTFLQGSNQEHKRIKELVNAEVLDTKKLTEELRESSTPYLIVSADKVFEEDISQYGFKHVMSINGYNVYLDESAYLGLWGLEWTE